MLSGRWDVRWQVMLLARLPNLGECTHALRGKTRRGTVAPCPNRATSVNRIADR